MVKGERESPRKQASEGEKTRGFRPFRRISDEKCCSEAHRRSTQGEIPSPGRHERGKEEQSRQSVLRRPFKKSGKG